MAERRCGWCGRKMAGPQDIRTMRDGKWACIECNEKGLLMIDGPERITLAHGGGDGKQLNHCPFCGSGGIVGRSDGTTECTLCHGVFTVQVQPAQSFAPQTINGQPVDIPGMPNSDAEEQIPAGSEGPAVPAPAPLPADATVGVPGFSDDEIETDQFITSEGQYLPRNYLVQNLALEVLEGNETRRQALLKRLRADGVRRQAAQWAAAHNPG